MKKLLFFSCSLLLFIFTSCNTENPLEKEQKEINEYLNNTSSLTIYSGVKVALRINYDDPKNIYKGMLALKPISEQLLKKKGKTELNILHVLKGFGTQINEDSLPTIIDNIILIEKKEKTNKISALSESLAGNYNNSTEHVILSSLWFCFPFATKNFYTYEALRITPEEITNPDLKALSYILKSITCIQNKWHFHGEKHITDYINYIESNKKEILNATSYFDSIGEIKNEKRYHDLHSLGYLIRGYAKLQSDREDEAFKDFEIFTSELEKTSFLSSNNLEIDKKMYLLAIFINIKNKNKEYAKKYISILEKDKTTSNSDNRKIKKLKKFLETNDEDDDLNDLVDKHMINKIIKNYAYTVATKSNMGKKIKQDEYGEILYLLPEKLNSGLSETKKAITNTVDSIGAKTKNMFNNLFK